MADLNECKLSGTIDRLRPVATRSKKPMAEIILINNQSRFRVAAFGNLADYLSGHAVRGERLTVTGTMSISNWQDEASKEWKNSFSITAWSLEHDGQEVTYQKAQMPPVDDEAKGQHQPSRRYEIPMAGADDPF